MKRLTISMSDALFDKLNQVENKSLFIRKLIEGELRKGITYSSDDTYESLVGDIEDLHHEIQSLSSRMLSIENQISGVKVQPSFEKDDLGSDREYNSSITSPTIMAAESDIGTLKLPADGQEAVFSDASDIQVSLSTQNYGKVVPVHSDEMHNMPFRSVVNVGLRKESISNITETDEIPMTSTIVTSGVEDQRQGSVSAPVITPSFLMPELSDVSTAGPGPFSASPREVPVPSTPSFVMPELSDVSTPGPGPFSASPREVSVPSTPSFVMPELSGAIEQSNPSPFEMPPAMSMPSFAAEGPVAYGIQMQPPSFMMPEMQAQSSFESVTTQPQIQNNDILSANTINMSPNERLQGNILMYLPHGARIKRSIIKGLVSKKFSAEEIDAQINLMISSRSLLVEVEDGVEYLLRP